MMRRGKSRVSKTKLPLTRAVTLAHAMSRSVTTIRVTRVLSNTLTEPPNFQLRLRIVGNWMYRIWVRPLVNFEYAKTHW